MSRLQQEYDQPVIIISAARSGSKLLRSVLAASPELLDFPYDMNYIWKYGNYSIKHDELTKDDLSEDICRFIRNYFKKHLAQNKATRIIEKSVPNSLRVGFVKAVFPDCKIIHLFRDGRDVSLSAKHCWEASAYSGRIQPKKDLLKKTLSFPITAAWPYLLDYALNYIKRTISKEEHVQWWGPYFKGMDEAIKQHSLLEICAMQWAKCVELSLQELKNLKENQDYINVRYEDLVLNPVGELQKVASFINVEDFTPIKDFAEANIKKTKVGSWKKTISSEEMESLSPFLDKYLGLLGYN